MQNTTVQNTATIQNPTIQNEVDRLDPKQTVWFQIDDATGFYVTVEEFLAVAQSQLAAAA
ncbi:hypothetical protein [Gordonia sp. (in: high G+C Gram-positive bacteria)]|uniref:hypothetical protein n=1 Tax=Gordonia sp. (in: high G+C Gram-positive bacteria) TaxID=84139 RepID=UPI0016B5E6D5|nr:hypothetical protein [Gordonia sp. (in: high G+C Gram-positive bacteria)]NLG47423.1 hypothetical protein [Gordonia sp. (in: high G+C Gram-positive bacteria)]